MWGLEVPRKGELGAVTFRNMTAQKGAKYTRWRAGGRRSEPDTAVQRATCGVSVEC